MPKARSRTADLDFAFFQSIGTFYRANRAAIRRQYKPQTRRFLDHCDPDRNPSAFLRTPQFEALEIYAFLKEGLANAKVEDIFRDWYQRKGPFAGRSAGGFDSDGPQGGLFEALTRDQYADVYAQLHRDARAYPNYIFALTMGTGKTLLVATCVYYEFVLASAYPNDPRFCHNVLIFAPDRTVLESLREIQSFDYRRIVAPEYVPFLNESVRYHYLDQVGTALTTIDGSRFNIVISNAQKIILRRTTAEKSPAAKLFSERAPLASGAEAALVTNQRFEKICRLPQLGIYVDEAHHAFGSALAKDLGVGPRTGDTSLRVTIDTFASSIRESGSHVVACYNYTGTPYVGRTILPEVVYAYGLRAAIDHAYLKRVRIHSYSNSRTDEFVRLAVRDFVTATDGLRPEATTPKLAIFASTIAELTEELRPALERVLVELGIPTDQIVVNVGDDRITSNDDLRDFNQLDSPRSAKRFVLLVNKGREGWNCRSLFGVALYRTPRSKIFVLQATMRCLRSIGDVQYTGQVYLSAENQKILDDELQQNFRVSLSDLEESGSGRQTVQVRVNRPIPSITLRRVHRVFSLVPRESAEHVDLGVDPQSGASWSERTERYRIRHVTQDDFSAPRTALGEDVSAIRVQRWFTLLSITAEIARYLNVSPLEVSGILRRANADAVLAGVNEFNELLYDVVIPRLFDVLFDVQVSQSTEEHTIDLVKPPSGGAGYYEVRASEDKVVRDGDAGVQPYRSKSFHLDAYCFDSHPERELFWDMLREKRIDRVYFTGMLTHGQSDFVVQYIDPGSRRLRTYYPDFVCQAKDGSWLIVEVKQDNLIEDPVVLAKQAFANEMAVASGMKYSMIRATDALHHRYENLFDGGDAEGVSVTLSQT